MKSETRIKRIHEGDFVAEVPVELDGFDQPWGPYLLNDDVVKLDAIRRALREGNVKEAQKHSRVFRMVPVPAA